MITDEDVATLFRDVETYMSKYFPLPGDLPTQIYRGKPLENQELGGCLRYMRIFEKSSIIPRYCFSCYKIITEARTVMELFKVMMVFDELDLPRDNHRKFMIETRPDVNGNYKAFLYSSSLDEASALQAALKQLVDKRIGHGIQVKLKRGCSEYARIYPDFARVENGKTFLDFNPEWEIAEKREGERIKVKKEALAAEEEKEDRIDTYSLEDYKVMLGWLYYAATIGDQSYLQVSPVVRQPLSGINKSYP